MSRSYKKHPAIQDLPSGFRDYYNRQQKLRDKQRMRQGKEVIQDEKYERSISMYSTPSIQFPTRK